MKADPSLGVQRLRSGYPMLLAAILLVAGLQVVSWGERPNDAVDSGLHAGSPVHPAAPTITQHPTHERGALQELLTQAGCQRSQADQDDDDHATPEREDNDDDEDNGTEEQRREEDDGEEEEVRVKLFELPKAVRKTLRRESRHGKVEEIEREIERGRIVYEAEVVYETPSGELEYEIEIAENGVLLSKILETEEEEEDDEEGDEDDDDEQDTDDDEREDRDRDHEHDDHRA